ncbi:MAG: hypothetical protein U0228_17655 [Myxococcaceae bacterium]
MRVVRLSVVLVVVCTVLAACSAPTGSPELVVTIEPGAFSVDISEVSGLVRATDSSGKVGTGQVTFTVDVGTVTPSDPVPLDAYGSATFTWTCVSGCENGGRVEATWTVPGSSSLPTRASKTATFLTSHTLSCVVGTATSMATATNLSLFGSEIFFDDGRPIPAGNYRLRNNGGCMRFSPNQSWTCNAFSNGSIAWWIIGASKAEKLMIAPGTFGRDINPPYPDVGYSSFAACDAANKALPPKDFYFQGGKLGIWLADDAYDDNTPGEGGKNPSWTLVRANCP